MSRPGSRRTPATTKGDNAMQQITWVKSSLSFANGNCVQIAELPDGQIGIRDSKSPHGPILRFTPDEWNAFTAGVLNEEFGNLGRT
jgi:Domain of unknown function (DUF397)